MYITNPTPEMLSGWYKTNKRLGHYLVSKFCVCVIHIDKQRNYYFARTELLKDALNKLPIWYKLFKKF